MFIMGCLDSSVLLETGIKSVQIKQEQIFSGLNYMKVLFG